MAAKQYKSEPEMQIDPSKRYSAEMVTDKGTMVFALDAISAPRTVNSFTFLAREGFYEGIVFHRVIPGFVLQAGCPEGIGTGGPGYRFDDELAASTRFEYGSLAMANAGPNTNGSQFFVISGPDGESLPPLYAHFGKIVKGLEVIKEINDIGTRSGSPTEPVFIQSITITEHED